MTTLGMLFQCGHLLFVLLLVLNLNIVVVRAGVPGGSEEQVLCYTELMCNTPPGAATVMSIRECCLDDPNGLSYNNPSTEICIDCVGKLC